MNDERSFLLITITTTTTTTTQKDPDVSIFGDRSTSAAGHLPISTTQSRAVSRTLLQAIVLLMILQIDSPPNGDDAE